MSPSAEHVGWVPQQPALYSKLTVAENLRLFARLEKVAGRRRRRSTRMLEQTGLGERADDEVGRLSGGNQQRVNIAIGLLRSPAALLLDEPSAALDPRQRERVWSFIGGLARPRARRWCSRRTTSARPSATPSRVLVLADGEVLFSGTPKELVGERARLRVRVRGVPARAGALMRAPTVAGRPARGPG